MLTNERGYIIIVPQRFNCLVNICLLIYEYLKIWNHFPCKFIYLKKFMEFIQISSVLNALICVVCMYVVQYNFILYLELRI